VVRFVADLTRPSRLRTNVSGRAERSRALSYGAVEGAPHTGTLVPPSPTILPLSPAYRMLAYGRCCSSEPAFLPAREDSIAPISPQCVNSHDSEAADDGYPCWRREYSRFT
jgi:hypothetical protein